MTMKTLSGAQREELLRKTGMTNDGLWFYQMAKNKGIDQANASNIEVVREFGRQEMKRLMRAVGIEKVETVEQYKELFRLGLELYVGELATLESEYTEQLHQIRVTNCFAYNGVKKVGVEKQYHCGPMERLTGWLMAMQLPPELSPQVGLCLMAHTGSCGYQVRIPLPKG
jgi:hypothetical protein